VTTALFFADCKSPAFVRDYDDFRTRLEALPNIVHALAGGMILPITDTEIRQTFLACIDTISETASVYENAWRAQNPGTDDIRVDPALFQEVYGIDLVKALWAGQFPRKFESGSILDVSRLSDDELAKLFNRKPQ
jgi:hypothetical protein